jgi:hypothetical protein
MGKIVPNKQLEYWIISNGRPLSISIYLASAAVLMIGPMFHTFDVNILPTAHLSCGGNDWRSMLYMYIYGHKNQPYST